MADDASRRRTVLRGIAASTTVSLAALAGCGSPDDGGGNGGGGGDGGDGAGGGGETTPAEETTPAGEETTTAGDDTTATGDGTTAGGGGEGLSGSDYPDVEEWLTETEVGDAAPNYDGNIVDERDADSVSVAVGAGSSGFAFEPAAVAVSTGTTVTWEWTGRGSTHNVVAEPGAQIGASDFEFSSGDPVESDSETFEQTFDEAGVALYHCEPHVALGMKGAVVVE